jgi:hypothetical protein
LSRNAADKTGSTYNFYGSRFGGCLHGQELSLLGVTPVPPNKNLQEVFRIGHVSEEETKLCLEDSGFIIAFASSNINQQHSVLISRKYSYNGQEMTIELASHLDGLLTNVGNWTGACYLSWPKTDPKDFYVFEHKSVKPDAFDILKNLNEDTFPDYLLDNYAQYAWQVSAQYWGMLEQLWEEHKKAHPDKTGVESLKEIWNSLKIIMSFHDKTSFRKISFLLDKPQFTKTECLDRCFQVVKNVIDLKISTCDSKWFCGYFKNSLQYKSLPQARKEKEEAEQRYLKRYENLDKMKLPKLKLKGK